MTQIISDLIHFTENSQTLLDLIIVNNVENGVGDNILPSNIRYHCPIYCALKLPKSYYLKTIKTSCDSYVKKFI